ncbi:hypothetical protein [Cohnella lupini]|nr:hypothetical protein [Cohnella lupini]
MMTTKKPLFLKNRLVLILVGVLVLFTVGFYLYAFRGFLVNPDAIFITSDIKDGKLVLNGSAASSATAYSGYTSRQKDGKLVLRIRYVPIANKWHQTGNFRIEISEKDMSSIRQVSIYDKDNRDRILWTRTNTS